MNHSLEDNELLDELSQDKAIELVPMSVYLVIMMTTGLFGNILVCVFYGKRNHVTPTTRLIVALALIDAITCVLMPRGVVSLCFSYKFTSSALCKMNSFVNETTAIASAMTLVGIAAFRFRAVCKPLASQFTVRHANITVLIAVGFAVLVSTPILVTHESVTINIRVNSTITLVGYDCNTSKEPSRKPLNLVVNVVELFLFIAASLTLFGLYGKIGVHISRFYKRKTRGSCYGVASSQTVSSDNKHKYEVESGMKNDTPDQGNRDTDERQTFDTVDEDKEPTHEKERNKGESNICETAGESNICETADSKDVDDLELQHDKGMQQADMHFKKGNTETKDQIQGKKAKIVKTEATIPWIVIKQALMLFVITLIFLFSFLPYFAITVSRTLSKNKESNENFTNWVQFCSRSYIINSIANPFVYGLFNTEFRNFVKRIFFR